MTTVKGNNVSYGSGGLYRAEFVYTLTYPTAAIARFAWECRGYHNVSLYDSSNSSDSSGDLTSAVDGAHTYSSSSGGYGSYGSGTTDIARAYGATTDVDQEFWIEGLADGSGGGARSTATLHTSVAARPYVAPTAPSGVSASRTSDTSHEVTWTVNDSTAGKYLSQKLQRWDNVSNLWSTIASALPALSQSFTDNTTIANRQYKYRVVAVNTTAETPSTASAATQTTPAAPTGGDATKAGSSIVFDFTEAQSAGMSVTFDIEHSEDGGAFVFVTNIASGVGTHTDSSPDPSKTHRYRARAKSTTGPTLYSTYTTSETVQLATPPNAPGSLSPNGVAIDATEAKVFSWLHSSADSSAQSKFQIRHRLVGAGAWTEETAVTSPVSEWEMPADTYANGTQFEWGVRTWGVHVDPSEYSATATVTTSARPTATINTPTASVTTSTLTLVWAYYDAEGTAQSEWQAELLDVDGAVLEARSDAGAGTTTTFDTPVADASDYTVRVRVRDTSGVWSLWDELAFSVAYLPSAIVNPSAVYEPVSAAMVITLTAEETEAGVTVDPVSVDLQRRINGGDWVTFAWGLEIDTVAIDPIPTINGLNEYRAIAYSALPSSSTSPSVSVVTNETRWVYVNGGPGFSQVCRVRADVDPVTDRGAAFYKFAGRKTNTMFEDTITDREFAADGIIDSEASPWEDWDALRAALGTKVLRDPTGRRMFGGLGRISAKQGDMLLQPLSFAFTQAGDDA